MFENVMHNIKNVMKQKNMRQKELASRLGISQVYLSELLRGVKGKRLNLDLVRRFANALGVDVKILLEGTEINIPPPEIKLHYGDNTNPQDVNVEDYIFIPLVESRVYANPYHAEVVDTSKVESYACIHVSRVNKKTQNAFCFKVRGDSMAPELRENDIVAIVKDDGEFIDEKAIYAVKIELPVGMGITLKRLDRQKNNLILLSANPNYRPVIIDLKTLAYNPVVGRVIWMWREYT